MDDRLKLMLLLNSVNANAAALAKFLLLGLEPRELWRPSGADAAKEVFSEKCSRKYAPRTTAAGRSVKLNAPANLACAC